MDSPDASDRIDPATGAWQAKVALDAHDWLAGNRTARAGYLMYYDEAAIFDAMVGGGGTTNFYRAETALFSTLLPKLDDRVPAGLDFVDLGPGGSQSVERRGAILAKVIGCRSYLAVDASDTILSGAGRIADHALPGIPFQAIKADFFTQDFALPAATRRFIYFGGSTISNLPGEPEIFPAERCIAFLKRLHTLAGPGGYLLIGFHAAVSSAEAIAPYSGPESSQLFLAPLRVLTKMFGATGIEETAWKYEPVWHSSSRCVSHELVCVQPCDVNFAGREFQYQTGQRLVVCLSYKISTETMQSLSSDAGFALATRCLDESCGLALWLLQAA